MVRIRLEKISMIVTCDCGDEFIAEDLEPECPYCDRRYDVSIQSDLKKLELKISSAKKEP
jgi:Zn finger protein HypA/HybF involved in hydrogenase expression